MERNNNSSIVAKAMVAVLLGASIPSTMAQEGLENVVDVMPGIIIKGTESIVKETKYGILTMKTAWKNAGSGADAGIEVGILLKAVGNEGIDNFHKGCIWQIGVSKNSSIEEAEVQQWTLPADVTVQPD